MATTFINQLAGTITLSKFINIHLECGKTVEEALQLASTFPHYLKYKYIRMQGKLVEREETDSKGRTSTSIINAEDQVVCFRYTPSTAFLFKATIELINDSYQYEPIVVNPLT